MGRLDFRETSVQSRVQSGGAGGGGVAGSPKRSVAVAGGEALTRSSFVAFSFLSGGGALGPCHEPCLAVPRDPRADGAGRSGILMARSPGLAL